MCFYLVFQYRILVISFVVETNLPKEQDRVLFLNLDSLFKSLWSSYDFEGKMCITVALDCHWWHNMVPLGGLWAHHSWCLCLWFFSAKWFSPHWVLDCYTALVLAGPRCSWRSPVQLEGAVVSPCARDWLQPALLKLNNRPIVYGFLQNAACNPLVHELPWK